MAQKFDFGGWATKNDLLCADGRIIRRDAFKDNDGQTVPLVYQHNHNDPTGVLGHALLENRDDGVYAYCSFNNTMSGRHMKEAVEHGDIVSLSIYANKLVQHGQDVLHGMIREVSVVLAGANPGAYIDNPILVHGEGTANESYEDVLDEAMIYTGEPVELAHADPDEEENKKKDKEPEAEPEAELKPEEKPDEEKPKNEEPENKPDAEKTDKEEAEMADKEKTVQDVFDELTEEQKKVVYFMIGQALEDAKGEDAEDNEEEGDSKMKHNVFDNDQEYGPVLSHADEMSIIADAKRCGSLRDAINAFCDDNGLAHDALAPVSGFPAYPEGANPANIDLLFPEFKDVRPGAPEIITDDQQWVGAVLDKVHKMPYNRIRTRQTDLRNIEEIRAKGYQKGREKVLAGNYQVAKRTTEPQTVYVYSELNRDDVQDITEFDYVGYQYQVDKIMLRYDLARAILIGDGRDASNAQKIMEDKIRPIWTDNAIFAIDAVVDATPAANDPGFDADYLYLKATKAAIKKAMVDYRGSGNLCMFYEQNFFNSLSLACDLNGRELYDTEEKLLKALGVASAFAVPDFAGKTRTVGNKTYKLLAILGNMTDYTMGAVKGGEITHFTDFELKFNQLQSLLETRCCGAISRVGSFIVLEEEVNPS